MNNFSTSDIVLAAFLRVEGFKMLEILKNGNKGTFIFTDVDLALIEEYDLGQALIEPKALNNEIKALTTAARR